MTLKGNAKFKGTDSWLVKWHKEFGFYVSSQKPKNLYFDGLLLLKSYKVLNKEIQNSSGSWRWSKMQTLKKNWRLVPKMTWGIWCILMRAVASLKICTLMRYFYQKYVLFEAKKYREVMCHKSEEWYKIWRGTELCFEKWHEEFSKFWPNTWKSQNLHFNGLLLTKVYNVWAKKLQRSYASLQWGSMETLKEKWLVVWQMIWEVWWIAPETRLRHICPKYIILS